MPCSRINSYLQHDAGAVAGLIVGTLGAAVLHVLQHLEGGIYQFVRLVAVNVHYHAHAAGIVLVGGVVQPDGALWNRGLSCFHSFFALDLTVSDLIYWRQMYKESFFFTYFSVYNFYLSSNKVFLLRFVNAIPHTAGALCAVGQKQAKAPAYRLFHKICVTLQAERNTEFMRLSSTGPWRPFLLLLPTRILQNLVTAPVQIVCVRWIAYKVCDLIQYGRLTKISTDK